MAFIDRHTGYIGACKTGDKATGTARVIMGILQDILGTDLYSVKRFKTDGGKNMIGGVIEEISKELKIWQDTSSAYHSAVGRIKHVVGDRKMEDCKMDIGALNLSQPYSNKTLTPYEELYGISSPVNGIPMTDEARKELVERKYVSDKIQRAEYCSSNPTLKPFSKEDKQVQTKADNDLSNDWVEKINGSYGKPLTCGDRVFYVDYQASGSNRWRKAIVLQRKQDYVYSSGIHRSHGYDLYDIKNCTTVSRTRQDIRKYKHTKIEREILERANKHLAEMRQEFLKSDFHNPNLEKPVEFEIKDYDDAVKKSEYKQIIKPATTPSAPV